MISGFTFIHNAINAGIPIRESIKAVLPYVDELVVIDAESNDGTRELLETLDVRIIDADWGTSGGETLARLHAMNVECKHDTILHFEADEVFDETLIEDLHHLLMRGSQNQWVYRLQIEQNFQRIRWYPELVHRCFQKGQVTKSGHTTKEHVKIIKEWGEKHHVLTEHDNSFLWDVTNCFRDNWIDRIEQQAELRAGTETVGLEYRMVGLHSNDGFETFTKERAIERLKQPHWTWKETPLNIPEILTPLVGTTRYE